MSISKAGLSQKDKRKQKKDTMSTVGNYFQALDEDAGDKERAAQGRAKVYGPAPESPPPDPPRYPLNYDDPGYESDCSTCGHDICPGGEHCTRYAPSEKRDRHPNKSLGLSDVFSRGHCMDPHCNCPEPTPVAERTASARKRGTKFGSTPTKAGSRSKTAGSRSVSTAVETTTYTKPDGSVNPGDKDCSS